MSPKVLVQDRYGVVGKRRVVNDDWVVPCGIEFGELREAV
jgi:hypothetical protein